jgi:electron transport complex protein RnfG
MSNSESSSTPAPEAPKSLTLIVTLGLIAMMSGLLVVTTYELTKPRIAANKQRALEEAVFTVIPEATRKVNYQLDESGLTRLDAAQQGQANLYAGYDDEGNLTGVAMEAAARGYQDVVRTLYGYVPDTNCIIGMTVLQSTETPGLGDKVETDPDFLANFDCLKAELNAEGTAMKNEIVTVKNGEKTDPWQIDGISGATVTSVAIGTGLRRSTNEMLPLLHQHLDELKTPPPAQ